jgi:hypothetical protein
MLLLQLRLWLFWLFIFITAVQARNMPQQDLVTYVTAVQIARLNTAKLIVMPAVVRV